ncbi:MAG: hypothetical protein GY754_29460 [bacterium]|nr:hypothetical protein [bacterium]
MQNKQKTIVSKLPKNGRIGRFVKILEKEVKEDVLMKIMDGSEKYESLKPEKKASWWGNAIENMENELGREKSVEIMNACGAKCCGKGQRKTAKRLMDESSSMEEFLEKVSTYEVKEGEIEYKLVDNNTIIGKHNRCFCGQVKKSKENFKNDTYCQCSVEFNRQFFQAAFDKPVDVTLKQSILNGGDFCEFIISIKNK